MNSLEMKLEIKNALTGETIVDSHYAEYPYEDLVTFRTEKQREVARYSEAFPNCNVYFSWRLDSASPWNFQYLMPVNQAADERAVDTGMMSWQEYTDKWYTHQEEEAAF